jgi:hypothetical protein
LGDDQVVVTEGQSRLQQWTRVVISDPAKQAAVRTNSGG